MAGCAFAVASRAPAKPPSRRARTSHRRRRFARASMSTRTSGWEGRGRGSLRLVYVRSLALHAARCFAAEGEVNNTVLYCGCHTTRSFAGTHGSEQSHRSAARSSKTHKQYVIQQLIVVIDRIRHEPMTPSPPHETDTKQRLGAMEQKLPSTL